MSHRVWACTRKGLFALQLKQDEWSVEQLHFTGDPVTAVAESAGVFYAAIKAGHYGAKVFRSRDQGVTWEELDAPVYPAQPELPAGETDIAWKLVQIWVLEGDGSGGLWCGTLPGGLFHWSEANGWKLVESLWQMPERKRWMGGGYDTPGVHSILVDPRNADAVSVAVSCGGVWHSSDRGVTWQLRTNGMIARYMPPELQGDGVAQDPHRVTHCPSHPDVLWCQHHCGIFRSVDGGTSWSECGREHFGFAVAGHPTDPNVAWFVPGKSDQYRIPADGALSVWRTGDGGKTFEAKRAGLPQQHCYDLIYRHALDVDRTGEHLMMGSTTGNVYATRDGGESWQALPAHFPPVYAIRFV